MTPVAARATQPSIDQLSRELVRDLQTPRPVIYWTDFLISSLLGWGAFAFAVANPFSSLGMWVGSTISVFALYRAVLFVHEISHFSRGGMGGFEVAWNFLAGFPTLLPSFVTSGIHQDHHRIQTYGTNRDPEYAPFTRSHTMTVVFAINSFVIPTVLAIRYLVIAPFGLLVPKFHRWLVVHASSLVINLRYEREVNPKVERKIRTCEVAILAMWGTAIMLAVRGILPWRMFGVWLIVMSFVSFVNSVRTLGAHHYDSPGQPIDRMSQLIDSIDHPGGWWTELWAPIGMRYHALHHYFPGMPYHNLGKGYRRLIKHLPPASDYHRSTDPSLPHSLRELYQKGVSFASQSQTQSQRN